jgi:hypothetical protein
LLCFIYTAIETAAAASCMETTHTIRAVQSAPPSRFSPPGAAVGQGVGWGPQGSLPDPAHLGPICEKSRFQDVKPLCSKPKSATNRRVNQVLKRSPRVTDHGCCS